MDARTFYNNYGQHIERVQRDRSRRRYESWPYVPPINQGANIPITDPNLKRHFVQCEINYDGLLSGVLYREGMITYARLSNRECPAISFQFSGCYMAKLCFRNTWYVFHISTSEWAAYDRKSEWKAFLSAYKNDISAIVMYKPTDERALFDIYKDMHGRQLPVTLAGLITLSECYTLVYDYISARVVTASDACTDYIRRCPQSVLCNAVDESYFLGLKP